MKFNPTAELSDSDAQAVIRDIVAGGTIIYSDHVKESMKKRSYSMHDVEYILRRGQITKKEFDKKHNNWAYVVSGDDLDGDSGSVVIAIIQAYRGILITVLS